MIVSPPLARGVGGVVLSYFMSFALSPEGGVSAYAGSVRVRLWRGVVQSRVCTRHNAVRAIRTMPPPKRAGLRVQWCACGWWVRASGGEWVTVCVGASPGLLCVPCKTVGVSLRVFSVARTATARAANVGFGEHTLSSTAERLWCRKRERRGDREVATAGVGDVEVADQHVDVAPPATKNLYIFS